MKDKLKLFLMVISSISLLVLISPTDIRGVILTGVLAVISVIILLWKHPVFVSDKYAVYAFVLSLIFVMYNGFTFYESWSMYWQIKVIAEFLHITNTTLIIITASVLSVFSCYLLTFIFRLVIIRLFDKDEKNPIKKDIFYCVVVAVVTVSLAQILIDVRVFSMGLLKFSLGVLIVSTVTLLLYALIGKMNISVTVVSALFMIISVVNYYVHKFRVHLFEPVDVFSANTAMNVVDNYNIFPIPVHIIICCLIWCALIVLIFCLTAKKKHKFPAKKRLIVLGACILSSAFLILCSFGLKTYHWNKEGAQYNGYILEFILKFKEIYTPEPDGYKKGNADEIADKYAVDTEKEDVPHIIVIMNEAFSDVSVYGDFSTDIEVMPFVASMKEDVISGYALASVYGGNTANSEFEFLTGNSMAYLSPNAVPYQQYIKSPSYSAVSYLKSNYGYKCIAMHPYFKGGWNRPAAYDHLGFDEQLFIDDFPRENYVRGFISDREMFEKIVFEYEENKEGPMFIFGVSMQNHGGYTYKGDNFENTVSVEGLDGSYPEAEQYLSLIRETDKAVEYLVSYFSGVDDDVVIVFFGDHQPRLDEDFYNAIGGAADTLDKQQNKYKVPFFVWANYDIKEEYVECTSLNYLSNYMYKAAGIPMPVYNRFLQDLEDVIPSINAYGYYSKSKGCYLPLDKAEGDEKTWLNTYEQLQYNCLFDKKHRNEKLFPVLNN